MSKKLKSKVVYKKQGKGAYDGKELNSRYLFDETGQWDTGLPKDFVNWDKISTIDKDGNVKPLVFAKPKKKKK
jgi:hypothetical protein